MARLWRFNTQQVQLSTPGGLALEAGPPALAETSSVNRSSNSKLPPSFNANFQTFEPSQKKTTRFEECIIKKQTNNSFPPCVNTGVQIPEEEMKIKNYTVTLSMIVYTPNLRYSCM